MAFFTLKYEDGILILLDQTKLPGRVEYVTVTKSAQVTQSIRDMIVRGAPAIGICAAFGVCIAARECGGDIEKLKVLTDGIRSARPTGTNLNWAVERMMSAAGRPGDLIENLEREADAMMREDESINRRIGENLLVLLPHHGTIMTYCNAGALATSKYGTALAPVYVGMEQGRRFRVYACETRPRLQGAKLTAFELNETGVDVTMICDNNAANVLKEGIVDAVIVGCDRVAANGDTANKVGTFALSIAAKKFGVPFYVAAPTPTVDFDTLTGDGIVVEHRDESEVSQGFGLRTVPKGVRVLNPAFDVTPAQNITAFATEWGVFAPDDLFRIKNRAEEKKD